MPVKIAVITDCGLVPRFALQALDALKHTDELTVFSCTNTRTRKRVLRHCAYYALNLVTVRNHLTRPVPVRSGQKRVAAEIEFASTYEGAWQKLPSHITQMFSEGGFDCVLKFGMGLLRVPDTSDLPVPILSFHHGDPDHYRGRPAGFWEMVEGRAVMGQMIQVIGNRLDAGQVVAFAETKVFPWSYRATLLESFRHSPLIINQAVENVVSKRSLPKGCTGPNYRLPANSRVIAFAVTMAARLLRRLAYGAFVEKSWRVSHVRTERRELPAPLGSGEFPPSKTWKTLPCSRSHTFFADPFFSTEPAGILVEAMNRRTGRGEIHLIGTGGSSQVSPPGGHFSYPATAQINGRQLVVPEAATWSVPTAYSLAKGALEPVAELRIEGDPKIVDPTLFEWQGRLYLFGNDLAVGSGALYLWSADVLTDRFELHPSSPILVSPVGARMGGGLIVHDGRLIRVGQDLTRGYGDGLAGFEITKLSPEEYAERPLGNLRFKDRRGPHTLNFNGDELLFDWYRERFTLLAGVRRLLSLAAAS